MPQAEPLTVHPKQARGFSSVKPQRAKGAPPPPVHYPDSDDEPMGESFLHIELSFDVFGLLLARYADRSEEVCVGCNNFVYYEEGNPRAVVTPDVFVAHGVGQRTGRRVFKVWEEGVTPDWVLEVTSKTTWREDEGPKRCLYERLGVREYWQYDPTGECLDPILKGRALGPDGSYVEFGLEERDGVLCHRSEALGLDLRLVGDRLRFHDPARGEYLLSGLERYIVVGEQRDEISEQREVIDGQRGVIDGQRDLIDGQQEVIDEQRRALRVAEARIRELERQQRSKG